jgi:hypothetical protein
VWWHAEYTTPELTAAIADCAGRRLRLQPRLDGEDLELRRWKWRQFHDLCEQVAPGGTFAELLPDPRFGREWIRLGVLAARYAGGPGKVRPGGAPGLYAMTFDVPPPGALWRLPLDGADSQQRRDRYSAEHWDRVERELGERYANEPVRLARYRERHDDETAWLRAALEDFERRRDGARR